MPPRSPDLTHEFIAANVAPDPALAEQVFGRPDLGRAGAGIFALVDGARSPFLPERIETSGLEAVCLYDGQDTDDEGQSAPWLIRLDPEARFVQGLFRADPQKRDPRAMFGAGIFLSSRRDLAGLRAHLRRYTRLSDEHSASQFFRLAEPGMLDALFCAAPEPALQSFFADVDEVIYPWPELDEELVSLISVSYRGAPPARRTQPMIDPATRQALTDFITDREARNLARSLLDAPDCRARAYPVIARLLRAGYDHPPRLLEAFRLLEAGPENSYPYFWAEVESGRHSLRRLLLVYRDHYVIEGILE